MAEECITFAKHLERGPFADENRIILRAAWWYVFKQIPINQLEKEVGNNICYVLGINA
jgi:hypothetical protein